MSLAGYEGATEGYEPVPFQSPDRPALPGPPGAGSPPGAPDQPGALAWRRRRAARRSRSRGASEPAGTALFRRRSARSSRRAVLHLQTSRDNPVAPDLAAWFSERGFHFYVAALRWPRAASRPRASAGRRPGGPALAAAFTELDARCQHLRSADGIDSVLVTAHGEGALAAALWCATPLPGSQADALVLYAPAFGRAGRRSLDVRCPVLVMGDPSVHLGRHVTWLRSADGEVRPDASDPGDRARFFDEMGRWLGAYLYGGVRDQLL